MTCLTLLEVKTRRVRSQFLKVSYLSFADGEVQLQDFRGAMQSKTQNKRTKNNDK